MKGDIVEYMLATKKNFTTAAVVADAWPEARRRIATDFLDKLEGRLRKPLKGWKLQRGGVCYEDRWAGFWIWKPHWTGYFGLALQWGDYGRDVGFGVYRECLNEKQQPPTDELLTAVKTIHASAKGNKWWAARVSPRDPGPDWRTPDALWTLGHELQFSKEMADQLLELARTTEPFIDRLVKQYSR